MKSIGRSVRAAAVAAALIVVGSAFTTFAARGTHTRAFTASVVAEQLGVRLVADSAEVEFSIGTQLTGSLEDPGKLATFGIPGMHKGARVTVVRLSYDKVLIEASESDPPVRKSVRIGLTANGGLRQPSA